MPHSAGVACRILHLCLTLEERYIPVENTQQDFPVEWHASEEIYEKARDNIITVFVRNLRGPSLWAELLL